MRKRVFFLCILLLCILTTLGAVNSNLCFCSERASQQTTPGMLDLSAQENPYELDIWLAGQWEYYPDQLLFSDSAEESELSGQMDVVDPIKVRTGQDQGSSSSAVSAYALAHTSTELNPDAEHVYLPMGLALVHGQHRSSQKASYRLILKNCPAIEDVDMVFSHAGIIGGNYKIFINGHMERSLVAPYSYPGYYTSMPSEVEIVIEVTNAPFLFNLCPRLAFKGIAMPAIDTYKFRLMGISCALISAFIIMMILVFALNPSRFRWHFGVGLIFSIYYVIINIWVTGYLGAITRIIPNYLLYHLAIILLQLGFLCAFYTIKKYYCEYYPVKIMNRIFVLLGCALVLYIAAIFVPCDTLFRIFYLLLLFAAFILWMLQTIRKISDFSFDAFLFQVGLLMLTFGSNMSILYHMFGIQNAWAYVYPGTIFVYIVLIFISTRYNQKQLMDKTIGLLKLEKETSKIQAAMLSSQMHPHFLHNALTSIQEMCYTEPEQAADMIVHLSHYLRKNIDFMELNDLVPFTDELNHIENYMYIQFARYGDALNFEKNIGYRDFMIPPLSVQPLIENAINYGVRRSSNRGTIRLETYLEQTTVHIKISNSGPGFDENKINPHHSISNIRKRLELYLNGTMTIHSSPDKLGTLVEIMFEQPSETTN